MLKLRVKEKIQETVQAGSFLFENTDGSTVFYKPGQFLTLVVVIGGKEYRRSYSFFTMPVRDKFPGVTVKRVEGGMVSNYLLDQLSIGDEVECLHPAGTFYPDLQTGQKKEYFLMASGSGITPLFSMLKTILHKEPGSNIHLVYANRSEEEIIYQQRLQALELEHPDRLRVIHVLSQPSEDWQGFRGRPDKALFQNLIQELQEKQASDARFFLCGPRDFMHTLQESILELNFLPDQIKKEDFVTDTPNFGLQTEHSQMGTKKIVQLLFNKEEYTFELSEGQTILDGALENNIRLPYSCTSGVCTACLGTCLEGEVDISQSDALSENEKKRGYILTCIGKPITDKVKIQVD